jgi:hypothetical protein
LRRVFKIVPALVGSGFKTIMTTNGPRQEPTPAEVELALLDSDVTGPCDYEGCSGPEHCPFCAWRILAAAYRSSQAKLKMIDGIERTGIAWGSCGHEVCITDTNGWDCPTCMRKRAEEAEANLKDTEERLDVHDGRRFSHGCSAVIKLIAHERDTAREELKAMKTRAEDAEAAYKEAKAQSQRFCDRLSAAEKERDSLAEKLKKISEYPEGKYYNELQDEMRKRMEIGHELLYMAQKMDALAGRLDHWKKELDWIAGCSCVGGCRNRTQFGEPITCAHQAARKALEECRKP